MLLQRRTRSVTTLLLPGVLLLSACLGTPPPLTAVATGKPDNRTALEPTLAAAMWRVSGNTIVDGSGEEVILRGIGFSNQARENVELPSGHHVESDFENLAQMGLNTARFYLSFRSFEDDDAPGTFKQGGWDWIDQNIEWASRHGIRLILAMQTPPGGQDGGQDSLWQSEDAQDRYVALWRDIAERYRAEPAVAGYDLLAQALPTKSKEQWQELAARTIAELRKVDQQHIVFVGRASSVGGDVSKNLGKSFVRMNDANVVYHFTFYEPYQFTNQNLGRDSYVAREGWYPDLNVPEVELRNLKVEDVAESAALPGGDSAWTALESSTFLVDSEKLALAIPIFTCDEVVGRASFDSLVLTRLSAEQRAARLEDEENAWKPNLVKWRGPKTIAQDEARVEAETEARKRRFAPEIVFELDLDTKRGWVFLSEDGKGSGEFITKGNGDFTALAISGTDKAASLSARMLRFIPEFGSEYRLSGMARGEDLSAKNGCRLQIVFYSSENPILVRDKAFLEEGLTAYLEWGKQEEVPLYMSEFGVIRDSLLPGRGGVRWVEDMLSLIRKYELSFSYYSYHGDEFGLYSDLQRLPSETTLNRQLRDMIANSLKEGPTPTEEERPRAGGQGEDVNQKEHDSEEGESALDSKEVTLEEEK